MALVRTIACIYSLSHSEDPRSVLVAGIMSIVEPPGAVIVCALPAYRAVLPIERGTQHTVQRDVRIAARDDETTLHSPSANELPILVE